MVLTIKTLRTAAAVLVCVGLFSASATRADINAMTFEYGNMLVAFDHTTGLFSVTQVNNASFISATAFNLSAPATALDRADMSNAFFANSFTASLTATLLNPLGLDNMSLVGGVFTASDLLSSPGGNPSLAANAVNVPDGLGDLDGFTFSGTTLTITGILSTVAGNQSILLNPLAGDWTYQGSVDGGILGGGADFTANQMTIGASFRDNWDTGTLTVLDVNITAFGDGTLISTHNINNADQLFEHALHHQGFSAGSGDLKIKIVPVPGAVLLGALGLGVVARLKRRLSA